MSDMRRMVDSATTRAVAINGWIERLASDISIFTWDSSDWFGDSAVQLRVEEIDPAEMDAMMVACMVSGGDVWFRDDIGRMADILVGATGASPMRDCETV